MTIAKLLGLTKDILYVEEFSHNYKFKWNYKKFSEVKYYDLTIKRFILTNLIRPKIVGSIYILTQNLIEPSKRPKTNLGGEPRKKF